jgi:hypothetical protein
MLPTIDDDLLLDLIRRRGKEGAHNNKAIGILLTGRPYKPVCYPLLLLALIQGTLI